MSIEQSERSDQVVKLAMDEAIVYLKKATYLFFERKLLVTVVSNLMGLKPEFRPSAIYYCFLK